VRAGRTAPLLVAAEAADAVIPGDDVAPESAALLALGQTIAAEHPELGCTCVDVQITGEHEPDRATAVVEELLSEAVLPAGEQRIAWRNGRRFVRRLRRVPQPDTNHDPFRIALRRYGGPDDLATAQMLRRAPRSGEIEIAIHCAGLNFRDVLISLGMLREHYERDLGYRDVDAIPLGFECAGIVSAVGPDVHSFAVGDRILALAEGAFASHVIVDATLAAHVPAEMSLEDAATIPMSFLTAHYALSRCAHLTERDRVLIHAGTGGLGQAAIQLTRRAGAEIFATASRQKHDFLRAQGISHVFDSRSSGFAEKIRTVTGGAGVSVVLNSLSGALLREGLDALRTNGRFVEVGRIDVLSKADAAALRPDVTYEVFDLGELLKADRSLIGSLFGELLPWFSDGSLRPLARTVLPREDIGRAFRLMQRAGHRGKIVIAFRESDIVLRKDASYLITGGLGGLGLACARELARLGATHIVLSGRSAAPTDAAALQIREIARAGCSISIVAGDVGALEDVMNLVARAGSVKPLAGVIHAAGVLDDAALVRQDIQRFARVMASKAAGAWNLHVATRGLDLSFFVCFSSVASIRPSPGQSNYAAANAFMDGLMLARRHRGLPGLTINWGPWSDVGMSAGIAEAMAKSGFAMIAPADGCTVLRRALALPYVQLVVAPRCDGTSAPLREPRPPRKSSARLSPDLGERDLRLVLTDSVSSHVAAVLGMDGASEVERHVPFSELGMDSLMVVELRNRLQAELDLPLPAMIAFDFPTIESLADHLARLRSDVRALSPDVSERGTLDLDSQPDVRALLDRELAATPMFGKT
jgi:NADPH:quinone reductase-like Zn-dependent oxidoreductase/acyl carrier protein